MSSGTRTLLARVKEELIVVDFRNSFLKYPRVLFLSIQWIHLKIFSKTELGNLPFKKEKKRKREKKTVLSVLNLQTDMLAKEIPKARLLATRSKAPDQPTDDQSDSLDCFFSIFVVLFLVFLAEEKYGQTVYLKRQIIERTFGKFYCDFLSMLL